MNEKLLKEYIDRVGVISRVQLEKQLGLGHMTLHHVVVQLVKDREIFLCRLDHGNETLLSRHLLFSLQAVYTEPTLSPIAQELYDAVLDHELLTLSEISDSLSLSDEEFDSAFRELQQKMQVAPLFIREQKVKNWGELPYDYLWVTAEFWMNGLRRPSRYNNLAYCLSEVRRLMSGIFTDSELNQMLYHSDLK